MTAEAWDTQTERLIQQALNRLTAQRTRFVMDRGRIVERGWHDDLLALCGIYARLCESSFLEKADAPELAAR